MTDELNEEELDLSAWEAPAPPEDLADGVIARMAGTGVVPSMPDVGPPRRRVGLIAGVAAACLAAAAGVFLIARGTERAKPTSGDVIAEKAQTLSLDGVRADLDPGTQVSWSRKGGVLHVQQPKGAASWRVADETVRIDAGATVASVEASGASLRVEVKMNQADTRVIGGAALTSMVVSMVTVVVYEGHVKVSGSPGQPTVIVQPGSTYSVTPPVKEPPLVGASVPVFADDTPMLGDLRISGGESATIHAATYPVATEFEVPTGCALFIGGVKQLDAVVDFDPGVIAYAIECNDKDRSRVGTLTFAVDDAKAQLRDRQTETIRLAADGRTYRMSFRDILPPIEVAGSGTLHVAQGDEERTFSPPVIPAGQIGAGWYTYWFDPAVKSTLVISVDYGSPVLRLEQVSFMDAETLIVGETLAQSTVTVRDLIVPIMADGSFRMTVDAGDTFALRVTHPHHGNHYYVLRSPTAVASATTGLSRLQITKVMTSVNAAVMACGSKSTAGRAGSTRVVVKLQVAATGVVESVRSVAVADAAVEECVMQVVKRLKFPARQQASTFSFPYDIDLQPACDASAFERRAWIHRDAGRHAAALAELEQALRCAPGDEELFVQAFTSACRSKNAAKATFYFGKLDEMDQTHYAEECTTNGVTIGTSTTCDANALKEKGMTNINMGQHAAALEHFEASLKCKDDAYIRQLAFMEACASGNSPKAKLYYKRLTPAQQSKFAQVCIRQKPPVAYMDDDEPAATNKPWGGPDDGTKGYLQVFSKPAAKILIDGVDTGLTTPVTGTQLMLTAGKHKVTFVIDQDRFTYPANIKVGQTETMTKDLQ